MTNISDGRNDSNFLSSSTEVDSSIFSPSNNISNTDVSKNSLALLLCYKSTNAVPNSFLFALQPNAHLYINTTKLVFVSIFPPITFFIDRDFTNNVAVYILPSTSLPYLRVANVSIMFNQMENDVPPTLTLNISMTIFATPAVSSLLFALQPNAFSAFTIDNTTIMTISKVHAAIVTSFSFSVSSTIFTSALSACPSQHTTSFTINRHSRCHPLQHLDNPQSFNIYLPCYNMNPALPQYYITLITINARPTTTEKILIPLRPPFNYTVISSSFLLVSHLPAGIG
jgi:hypothetical protein